MIGLFYRLSIVTVLNVCKNPQLVKPEVLWLGPITLCQVSLQPSSSKSSSIGAYTWTCHEVIPQTIKTTFISWNSSRKSMDQIPIKNHHQTGLVKKKTLYPELGRYQQPTSSHICARYPETWKLFPYPQRRGTHNIGHLGIQKFAMEAMTHLVWSTWYIMIGFYLSRKRLFQINVSNPSIIGMFPFRHQKTRGFPGIQNPSSYSQRC